MGTTKVDTSAVHDTATASRRGPTTRSSQQLRAARSAARNVIVDLNAEDCSVHSSNLTPPPSEASAPATIADDNSNQRSSRYLRESDRRNIILRIQNGERQSALAKEYGVTRAAICHINKKRVEILSRSHRDDVYANARHPKRRIYITPEEMKDQHIYPVVSEVKSPALNLLLTKLRSKHTSSAEYRLTTNRLFRMLLEQALVLAPTDAVNVLTPAGCAWKGLQPRHATVGVGINEAGLLLLDVFRAVQPESTAGSITIKEKSDQNGMPASFVKCACVPHNLQLTSIFLLEATTANSDSICTTIQTLLDFGATETSIFFVCLVSSHASISAICNRYPAVRIVTASIDSDSSETKEISPGIGIFLERYLNMTTMHQSDFGPAVCI